MEGLKLLQSKYLSAWIKCKYTLKIVISSFNTHCAGE